jgi:hypothetical protein
MFESGQSRRFDPQRVTSGLSQSTNITAPVVHGTSELVKKLHKIDAIGHEPVAVFYIRTKWVNGRQTVFLSQIADQLCLRNEFRTSIDEERVDTSADFQKKLAPEPIAATFGQLGDRPQWMQYRDPVHLALIAAPVR